MDKLKSSLESLKLDKHSNYLEKLTDVKIIKPCIKWAGGKTQIIQEIFTLFPNEMNNYYEPFLGGGSVLLGVLSLREQLNIKGNIFASDINVNVISMYKNIQENPKKLIKCVGLLINEFNKCSELVVNRNADTLEEAQTHKESYYFYTRKRFNGTKNKTTCESSAMFLFMNKTCFRGLYREGPKGFNVPYGNYKNPSIISETSIMEISKLIKDVTFKCCDYNDIFKLVKKGDFIYLDPPYVPISKTSFVSYNKDGFDSHEDLFNECIIMDKNKVKLLMSNSETKLIGEFFEKPDFNTETILCNRSINSKNPDSKVNEVLIYNY